MRMSTKHARAPHADGHRPGRIIDEVKGRFSDLAAEAMTVEGELYADAKKRGVEFLDDAKEKGRNALKGTESWIKKNPGTAVGSAFVLGAALAAWFGRSKK